MRFSLFDELMATCDVDPEVARSAVARALEKSGCITHRPDFDEAHRVLPELERELEGLLNSSRAHDAVQRLALRLRNQQYASGRPSAAPVPSLAEVTQRLRESNQRLSERDLEGELREVEAELAKKGRSMPPSRP